MHGIDPARQPPSSIRGYALKVMRSRQWKRDTQRTFQKASESGKSSAA